MYYGRRHGRRVRARRLATRPSRSTSSGS